MSIPPSGPIDPTSPPHRGPGRAARVLRALFVEAGSRAKQSLSPRPNPKLRPKPSELPARQKCSLPCEQGRVGYGLLLARGSKVPPTSLCMQGEGQSQNGSRSRSNSALYAGELSQPRSGCVPSGAQDARRSTRGPCEAVRWGRQAPQGESTWMSIPFRQHMDVLSKSPAPPHGLAGQGCPASAKRGGLLFWLLFSWPRCIDRRQG
jgi:hypothetical protein